MGVFAALLVTVPVLSPTLRETYGLSLGDVGWLIFVAVGAQVLTHYGWGMLNDRFSERTILPLGLGAAGGVLIVPTVTDRYAVIVTALILATALTVCVSTASSRAIMGWFGTTQRGLAFGIRQTAAPLGGALAALVLPFAVTAGGLGSAFAVLAAACLVTAVVGALALREPPFDPGELRPTIAPIRDARLWRLTAGSTLLISVQGAVVGFLVLFLHVERGLSTSAAAGVLAASSVAGGCGRLLLGFLSDRRGERVQLIRVSSLAIGAAAAASAIAIEAPNYALVPAFFVCATLTLSWNALIVATTIELVGRSRAGTALGLQQTVLAFAFAGVAPVFVLLVKATSWQIAFGILALLPLAAYRILGPLVNGGSTPSDGRPSRFFDDFDVEARS
jgi:sugar phosphate permease